MVFMKKIETMYAFICNDTPTTEGVPAIEIMGSFLPLYTASLETVEELKKLLATREEFFGKNLRLVKFTNRVDLSHEFELK